MTELDASSTTDRALAARVFEVEAQLATERAKLAEITAERDRLRRAYQILFEHYELLRRKLFVASAERIDVTQLELEFADTKAKLDALAKQLGTELEGSPAPADVAPSASPPSDDEPKKTRKPKTTPTARRDLRDEDMPEKRIEILDPALEGMCERVRFEESCRLGYQRGGPVRIVLARAIYKKPVETHEGSSEEPVFELVTVKKPKELVERGLLAPSLIAHMLVSKYRFGLPFHRLALMLLAQGVRLDDGTMCRYAEDVGATLGCIVDAMAKQAKETAFCLSTDATGVCIQPEPLASGQRQACRKGHFFVVLADRDHVFFEYQREHTSKAVCEMFRGFTGYVQADAHAIYDALFRGEARANADDDAPTEVGCLGPLPQAVLGGRHRHQRCRGARRASPPSRDLRARCAVGESCAKAAARSASASAASSRRRLLRMGRARIRARQRLARPRRDGLRLRHSAEGASLPFPRRRPASPHE